MDVDRVGLVDELARIVAIGGAARLLDAPIARRDVHDLPERWWPDAAVAQRLLARLLWLAYVDLEVELDTPAIERVAARTDLCWRETDDGVAWFEVLAWGRRIDHGELAAEVGRAFLAWMAGSGGPPRSPTRREGTIAAIYLGLGVLVADTAWRDQGRPDPRHPAAQDGEPPLSLDEVIYLLAVQATLRGESSVAATTLPSAVRARIDATVQRLTPRRTDLGERLAIDLAAPRRPLERDPTPIFARADAEVAFHGITAVRWDDVGAFPLADRDGRLFAIWPEPIYEDLVLARAGVAPGSMQPRSPDDQSAPVVDLYDLIEDELRAPVGLQPWNAPAPAALALGTSLLWLWIPSPHEETWSLVLAALPRPIGDPALPPPVQLTWVSYDVELAIAKMEPIESRYAWVPDLTITAGATVDLHPIQPTSAEPTASPLVVRRTVQTSYRDDRGALILVVKDGDGAKECWEVYELDGDEARRPGAAVAPPA